MEILAHMGKNGRKRMFFVALFYQPINTPTSINQVWFNSKTVIDLYL